MKNVEMKVEDNILIIKVDLTAYSGAFRTPIPEQSGHLFHLIPDTHSSPFRTLYKV
jgi:hypothetical protein